jgi:hypothetical protein
MVRLSRISIRDELLRQIEKAVGEKVQWRRYGNKLVKIRRENYVRIAKAFLREK